jgi:hypothetical protein
MANVFQTPGATNANLGKGSGLSPSSPSITPGVNPGPYGPPDKPDNAEHVLRPKNDAELQQVSKGE